MTKYYDNLQEVSKVAAELETSLEQAVEFDHVLIHTGRLLKHRAFAQESLEDRKREEAYSSAARYGAGSSDDRKEQELFAFDAEAQQAAAASQARAEQFGFQFLAGVVSKQLHPVLERQIFLSSRGNCFTFFQELEGDENKVAFILFFLGATLRRKLARICESMGVRLYLYPENATDVQQQRTANSKQITDLKAVHQHTAKQRADLLAEVAVRYGPWRLRLLQEKAVYAALNKMTPQGRNMVCNLWTPTSDRELVQQALDEARVRWVDNSSIHSECVKE